MANVEDRTGEFVTLQQAAAALGVGPWNMPGLLAGAGITAHRLPLDKRGKWIRRADVERLRALLYEPVPTATVESGAARG